jgi:hypothetical protein
LNESSEKFGDHINIKLTKAEPLPMIEKVDTTDDQLMKDQLNFICKISADIDKATKAVMDS